MSHEVQVKDELLALAALGAMRLALLKVRITGGLCDPSLALAAGEILHRRRLISLHFQFLTCCSIRIASGSHAITLIGALIRMPPNQSVNQGRPI
jgi:hypothetical protein